MVTTEIKARYQNVELNIAYVDWRNVYLLPCQKLIIEVHKGRLCYRIPATSKRISKSKIMKNLIEKEITLQEYVPF